MSGGGLTRGKAYRVRPGSPIVGLLLPVADGSDMLVLWYEGRRIVFPPDHATAVREEPDCLTLCAAWGITLQELDRYVEDRLYAKHPDVAKVRADPRRRVSGGGRVTSSIAHRYFGPH